MGDEHEHVCVYLPNTGEKELGVALWRHNVPLYSGSVVGELLTSGCFLRETEKHRKSRLECECVCEEECVSDGKLKSFMAVFCLDLHTPRGPVTSQHQNQLGWTM